MTRFPSRLFGLPLLLTLAGCIGSSGAPAPAVAEANIAPAYLPLHATVHLGLDTQDGAAVVIAPGIAATNAHNARMVDPKTVIGARQDFDLLFFRIPRNLAPRQGEPVLGGVVEAYGQGADAELRIAHGVVREIHPCSGCGPASAYFVYVGNAGPGFSGGPVLDSQGQLVGITFGYKDEGGKRLMYAYAMSRVMAELSALQNRAN